MIELSRRDLILGATAAVLFIFAAVLYCSRAGVRAELPSEARTFAVCLACQEEAEVTHELGEIAPFECPECDEIAVYGWQYCRDCKKRFVPGLVRYPDDDFPRLPAISVCPLCGGNRSSGYNAASGAQKPVGDAPLPDWPVP